MKHLKYWREQNFNKKELAKESLDYQTPKGT